MAGFIQNILWNSVSGFVEAGTRTAGGYAGDALIKAGDMIDNGGRSVGNGLEKKFTNYGSAISGQAPQKPSAKALPATARKPVVKRSNSTPASNKPTTGATKYPGPKSAVGGIKPAAGAGAKKPLPSYASSSAGAGTNAAKSGINRAKSVAGGATAGKTLPKPYSPGGNLSFPEAPNSGSGKKTAVKPGQSKPFNVAGGGVGGAGGGEKKPYPGTTTMPGQGKNVPVQSQKYKAASRMAAPAKRGDAVHVGGF